AIYNVRGSTVRIEGESRLEGNVATEVGGGIENRGELFITDSSLVENLARTPAPGEPEGRGGGLANEGTATITDSTFDGNIADRLGGGIHNDGTLTMTGGSVINNAIDGP